MQIPKSAERWLDRGKSDIPLFAYEGLGIRLHDKQVEAAEAVLARQYAYYTLDWANRAGKTTGLIIIHSHQLFYKVWLVADTYEEWLRSEYATLHCAPLNELAGRCHTSWDEITKGTHPAQRDESGKLRPSPLAPFYVAKKERDNTGADRMVVRCANGAKTDFRSTEGKAARVEGGAWRLISWDEWPSSEGDPEDIRFVLDVRLTARASDFDAPIILTGTRTPDTEHIAKEFDAKAEDPENPDWWGSHASRLDNPTASRKAIERAKRNLDPEDFNRSVLGIEGGAKGRIFPSFLVDPVFRNALDRFTPPHPHDGYPPRPDGKPSPWFYLHLWDLAIAAAENIGAVWRVPADWLFSPEKPIVGVAMKRIPGSRTLTTAEIVHTIEETFLPYGGLIVLDTTDAHGKSIYRELRAAGYPVEPFTFNERVNQRPGPRRRGQTDLSMLRKERGITNARLLLGDGLTFDLDKQGEPKIGPDDVAKLDLSKPYGSLHLPATWTVFRDQLALLKPDDQKQKKDAAMTVLMGADIAIRRRAAQRRGRNMGRLSIMGGR